MIKTPLPTNCLDSPRVNEYMFIKFKKSSLFCNKEARKGQNKLPNYMVRICE